MFKPSKEVERQSKINLDRKARKVINSKRGAAKEDYTPAPHHRPGNTPVLPKLSRRTSDKQSSPTGARKASADHSPVRRGRKRDRSSSVYTVSCSESEESTEELPISASSRKRTSVPRSPPRTPSPGPSTRRSSPPKENKWKIQVCLKIPEHQEETLSSKELQDTVLVLQAEEEQRQEEAP